MTHTNAQSEHPTDTPQPAAPRTKRRGCRSVALANVGPINRTIMATIQRGFQIYSTLPLEGRRGLHDRTKKRYPLRDLAQKEGLPISTLWRWLATYLLYCRFPELAQYQHIGVGHVSVILGVEPDCQLYFLRTAEIARWSRRTLEAAVREHNAHRARATELSRVAPVGSGSVDPDASSSGSDQSCDRADSTENNRWLLASA